MIPQIVIGLLGLIGVGLIAVNWDKIASKIRRWLNRHNLEKSHLASAFIMIDRVIIAGKRAIKTLLRVKVKGQNKTTVVEEETHLSGTEDFKAFDENLGSQKHKREDVLHLV